MVVFLIGLSTVLAVLWVNALRQTTATSSKPESTLAETFTTQIPATKPIQAIYDLPKPQTDGSTSVESTLKTRRSRRTFADRPLTQAELGQVLWSAQGITDDQGHRAAPSAKSAYPYTLYVVVRDVTDVPAGLYQYLPEKHQLGSLGLANAGQLLTDAGVQDNSQQAPAVIALAAASGKMVKAFPDADPAKNVYLEAGHIGQNIYLQAESLGLSTVVTGGFDSKKVGQALQLDALEEVVYLVPVGGRDTAESETATAH